MRTSTCCVVYSKRFFSKIILTGRSVIQKLCFDQNWYLVQICNFHLKAIVYNEITFVLHYELDIVPSHAAQHRIAQHVLDSCPLAVAYFIFLSEFIFLSLSFISLHVEKINIYRKFLIFFSNSKAVFLFFHQTSVRLSPLALFFFSIFQLFSG